jgi:DNA-binding response OmpR family regulator
VNRILLVDDDAKLRELLASYLADSGFAVQVAPEGRTALDLLRREGFDAVVLDIMMPGLDGLEVLRTLRSFSSVPVLMLTARGDEADRVVGLEIGADDYIGKPFSPRELLARLRAVLRRTSGASSGERLTDGELVVELGSREVLLRGVLLEFTALEFDVLVLLMRRAGRVVSRETLLRETGRGAIVDRAIDVHVSHIRQKIGAERIKTVRGAGYVFGKGSAW